VSAHLIDAALILAQAPAPAPAPDVVSTGEAIVFWVLGPIALLGALGMVFARNAVHSALALVATMFSLAIFYLVQQAPFLGFVQIIVYTGAIMMLFLFVLMMVGRDSSDSVVEVLRGQRLAALVFGVGLAVLLVAALGSALTSVQPVGLAANDAGSGGNVTGLGRLVFTDYLFAFELTSALLITAALGAMVLAYAQTQAHAKKTQRETVTARLRGEHDRISPLPGPGVFATGNSVAVPALLPDGSIAPESISAIIDATPVEENPPPAVDAHALTDGRSPERGEADPIGTTDQRHADARALAGGSVHGHEETQP
jgi:NADH-quinone oxidoreductase subunit J